MIAVDRFRPDERQRWAELWTQYLAFYETTLPDAQYDHTWARLRDGRMQGFGARDADGRLIGITHYLYHEHGWSAAPCCYLQDLFTDTAARGQGVARALIQAVAAAARQDGADRLYWLTQHTNATARRLYDALAVDSGFLVYRYPLG